MLTYKICTFEELTSLEVYKIGNLRQVVFVVEQHSPYLDFDFKDLKAWHILGFDVAGDLLTYCRVLPPFVSYPNDASIGRVVNHPAVRGKGEGKHLMQLALQTCAQKYPDARVRISAQSYLLKFYSDLGFVATGKHYDEDGIPHDEMLYAPTQA